MGGRVWMAVVGLVAGAASGSAQEWCEFRGPGGTGLAALATLPHTWDEPLWKCDVPGRGWSSPVIADGRIWITAALESATSGARREARLRDAPSANLEPYDRVELLALAYDLASGELLHQVSLFVVDDPPLIHARNSFASPTPALGGGRVYCSFGTMGCACLDAASGHVVWRNTELQLDHETGPGSSPILFEELMIVHADGTDRQFVVALDAATGARVWTAERSGSLHPEGMMRKAFSTPILVPDSDGSPQLISVAANWVYAYDPRTGRELWKLDFGKLGYSNVPRPLFDGRRLFVCTGFTGPELQAIRMPDRENPTGQRIWSASRAVPTIPSPILVDGLIFMVSDAGIASCLDAADGSTLWQHRLPGAYTASPILVGRTLLFCSDRGDLSLIEPAREFRMEEALELGVPILATPAPAGKRLVVRTQQTLIAFGDE